MLDVSGNEELGNDGSLQLLTAGHAALQLHFNMAACGMKSPLPNELISVLLQRLSRDKIEIAGNEIDQQDREFLCQ